jgi:hypothetical protein
MRRALLPFGTLILSAAPLLADLQATVDLLDPSDGGPQAPAGVLVLDLLVDVDDGDAWTASGLAASTVGSSTIIYSDTDPNNPLQNPGVNDQFTTSISLVLPRFGAARFEDGGALILGSDCPLSNHAYVEPHRVVVSWSYVPDRPCAERPSADGAIARVAVELDPALICDGDVNCCFAVYAPDEIPDEAVPVLEASCERPGSFGPFGLAWATCDIPQIATLPFIVAQTPVAGSCRYDLNRDRTIDVGDLAIVLTSFGAIEGQTEFNPQVDFDADGRVELQDVATFLSHWGAF